MKRQKEIAAQNAEAGHPPRKITLRHLPTAVHGLDKILGGGLPAFAFNRRGPKAKWKE